MEYEWDPNKEATNLTKHGISFSRAVTIFDDPNHFEEDSTKPEHVEQRTRVIGMVGEILATVTYTNREDRRRIISARRARDNERKRYDRRKTSG
ncbi:MAG: BrnT family toxin [Thermomicrobiales bacterium]|nr:BrnT family toxin [Thermomicrobiales bacterium]